MYQKKRSPQYGSSKGKAENAYSVDSGSQNVTAVEDNLSLD